LTTEDIKVSEGTVNAMFMIEKRYKKVKKVTKFRATDGVKLRWRTREEAMLSGHTFEEYEGYETKPNPDLRNVVFPLSEPLAPAVVDWRDFVFETHGEGARLFNLKYNRAYRLIRCAGMEVGLDFPPHRLRAERATQLAIEYEFTDGELTEWFNWKDPIVAHEYTTLVPKIIKKMFKKQTDEKTEKVGVEV